jgi:hypothetical protein
LIFSHQYSKLSKDVFTTIRKSTGYYSRGQLVSIKTPKDSFFGKVVDLKEIKKDDITEELAMSDADTTREKLIELLEKWYGKIFDNFVLLTIQKEPN